MSRKSLRRELLEIRAELDRLRDRVDWALEAEATPIDALCLCAEVPSVTEAEVAIDPSEPIENLKLPRRALTCLHKAGVETVGQLTSKAYSNMWKMPNCGKYTVRDIDRALRLRGLTLKGKYFDME